MRFIWATCIDSVQVVILVGVMIALIVLVLATYQGPEVLVSILEAAR
jgi:hypothetical protein